MIFEDDEDELVQPRDSDMGMVNRVCLKPACDIEFLVLETSDKRYCCDGHNPKPVDFSQVHRPRTTPGEQKQAMIVIMREGISRGWSGREIAEKWNEAGFRTNTGNKFQATNAYNFMAVERKAKETIERDNKTVASKIRESAPGPKVTKFVPDLIVAIIEDKILDAEAKINMLRLYIG